MNCSIVRSWVVALHKSWIQMNSVPSVIGPLQLDSITWSRHRKHGRCGSVFGTSSRSCASIASGSCYLVRISWRWRKLTCSRQRSSAPLCRSRSSTASPCPRWFTRTPPRGGRAGHARNVESQLERAFWMGERYLLNTNMVGKTAKKRGRGRTDGNWGHL